MDDERAPLVLVPGGADPSRVGHVPVSEFQLPTLDEIVAVLKQRGDLRTNGWVMADTVTPAEWQWLMMGALSLLDSSVQWVVADALVAGRKWDGVQALDISTGRPYLEADAEERAFDGAGSEIVPWDYHGVMAMGFQVAEERRIARQTLYNWTSVASRFPPASRATDGGLNWMRPMWDGLCRDRPSWRGALFSHYAACTPRDLPERMIDEWLTLAAEAHETGYTVSRIEAERAAFRRRRDERVEPAPTVDEPVAIIEPAPPVAVVQLGGSEEIVIETGLSFAAAVVRYKRRLANLALSEAEELTDAGAQEVARAVITWIYREAPIELLLSAMTRE